MAKIRKTNRVISQVTRLTEYQKNVIEYLVKTGKTVDQIVSDDQLRRSDGSRILKKTVSFWVRRLRTDGKMVAKRRSGRPKILKEKKQVEKLIDYVKTHKKMAYSEVKSHTEFDGHRRSLNRYCLNNNISMRSNWFLSVINMIFLYLTLI